jgi:dTDP-glucose 4,6-dehydratase
VSTGQRENIEHLAEHPRFEFRSLDVTEPLPDLGQVDVVFHLASAASPNDYHRLPIETLRAGSAGTEHGLELAERTGARFVLASTSEVYGDPEVHPQVESYVGHVNPIGPRSVYDEAKRYAEAAGPAPSPAPACRPGRSATSATPWRGYSAWPDPMSAGR